MAKIFNQNIPHGALNDFSCQQADLIYDVALAQDTEKNFTVPGNIGLGASASTRNAFIAVIRCNPTATVLLSINGTADVPGSSFATSDTEVISSGLGRHVWSEDVMSFITHDTAGAYVSVALYAIPV